MIDHICMYLRKRLDCGNEYFRICSPGSPQCAGGQDQGSDFTQLSYPCGLGFDRHGTNYVADYGNHRAMSWVKGATQDSVVMRGNGRGEQANQFSSLCNLSFDPQNNSLLSCIITIKYKI